ncbi:MAG: hypothetical protein JWQ96_249 [Segetibacter sp.]|nr:hypothetical protein [Segetibacter sp.]
MKKSKGLVLVFEPILFTTIKPYLRRTLVRFISIQQNEKLLFK